MTQGNTGGSKIRITVPRKQPLEDTRWPSPYGYCLTIVNIFMLVTVGGFIAVLLWPSITEGSETVMDEFTLGKWGQVAHREAVLFTLLLFLTVAVTGTEGLLTLVRGEVRKLRQDLTVDPIV
jgi:hypothetical protein